MAYKIPNNVDAFNTNQAEPDKVDFDILTAGSGNTGVISGCEVTAQGSPDMTVSVASGFINYQGKRITIAENLTVDIDAADVTNPRFDLIFASTAGTVIDPPATGNGKGTAAADPVFPAIPANRVVLAAVYVPANDTTIATNQIVDKRVLIYPDLVAAKISLSARIDPYAAGTEVDFDTTDFDIGGMVNLVTNRITVPIAGIYAINALADATISVTTGNRQLRVLKNGNPLETIYDHRNPDPLSAVMRGTLIYKLVANDYITADISGSNITALELCTVSVYLIVPA